ncbi:FAD-dependent monooxygenase [Pseudonocardia sp. EV170527-09]|uniref:FAD-dependent monooxygenase n=1 Tax=Pseudonocardia sp. EV170527-09 TaxID=2603411 RepID=UPI001387182D|nr:FAD-dependent monooxygenase [Pseudonocardia sp. EV170527-09]
MTDILISGAGIAETTLAWWLRRHGFRPVVVESAPGPRPGGQAVDVRGPALTVVDRMGLGAALRAARTAMDGMSLVDEDGTEVFRSTEVTLTGGPVASDDVEILRDDLAALLTGALHGVEHRWGDRVVALDPDPAGGARVRFASGTEEHYDLVVGADGQHSGVRRLALGPDDDGRLVPLGQHVAVFTLPNTFGLSRWQVFLQRPDAMAGLYTAHDDTEVRVMLGFSDPDATYHHRDLGAQRALVTRHFAGGGWWLPELLAGMDRAEDLYLTPITQVRLPTWSRGPVALLGDAAWCPTLLSGQGTTLAVVGAYVLAGELARSGGDPGAAAAAHERRMRGWVEANQELALTNAARVRDLTAPDTAAPGLVEHWAATAATALTLPEY